MFWIPSKRETVVFDYPLFFSKAVLVDLDYPTLGDQGPKSRNQVTIKISFKMADHMLLMLRPVMCQLASESAFICDATFLLLIVNTWLLFQHRTSRNSGANLLKSLFPAGIPSPFEQSLELPILYVAGRV